jgi:transcriptional regulator with XRE-family HTH domain
MNLKFGSSLVKLRKTKNLTQKKVADGIFVSRSTYAAWEANKNEVTFTHIFRLIKFYGISITELLLMIENENKVQLLIHPEEVFADQILQEIRSIKTLINSRN